jgi:hypothetical protein
MVQPKGRLDERGKEVVAKPHQVFCPISTNGYQFLGPQAELVALKSIKD